GRPPHDRPGRSRHEGGLTWGLLLPPTPFSATMKAAAAIARILKEERCEYLFCFPISPVIEECARLEIRPIVGRTERPILNMAAGYSRASNGQRIGVAAAQHGPGAENAYAGVAQAFADGSPLLFLPGGNARARAEIPPNFDAAANYRGVAKWSAILPTPESVPDRLRRAFTLLRRGRGAPVGLGLPVGVGGGGGGGVAYAPGRGGRGGGGPAGAREAVRLLRGAERPVVWAGQGVLWAEAWDELRAFAEFMNVPVMTTLAGKSAFPEDHPLSLGCGGYSGTAMVDHFLRQADLVFGI